MFVELGFKSIFRKLVITEMVSCKFQWWHTTAINGATFLVICHLMDKTESNNWSRLDLFFLLQKFIVLRNLVVSYYSLWRYHCGIILLDFFLCFDDMFFWNLIGWWYLLVDRYVLWRSLKIQNIYIHWLIAYSFFNTTWEVFNDIRWILGNNVYVLLSAL